MPFEDEILDLGHDDDDNLQEEAMFYEVNKTCDCYFDQSEINSNSTKFGDQSIQKDHTTKEYKISFCGGATRAWKEGKADIKGILANLLQLIHQ